MKRIMVCFEVPLADGRMVRGDFFTDVDAINEPELIRVRELARQIVGKRMALRNDQMSESTLISVLQLDG